MIEVRLAGVASRSCRVHPQQEPKENGKATMATNGKADEVHVEVEARLRHLDQRYTRGRRAIVDLLVSAGRPVSIGDVAEGLPELPLSSAYRHLADLQIAALVRRVAANDEFARFELAEDLTEHHHHLHCVSCGTVIDFTPSATFERNVTQAVDQLAESQGFQPHGHRLDVLGLCADCQ
jgi:Fe2+ or Zn2+ uptake regulation protein